MGRLAELDTLVLLPHVNPSMGRGTPDPPRARRLGRGGVSSPESPLPGWGGRDLEAGGVCLGCTWLGKASTALSRVLRPQHPPSLRELSEVGEWEGG